MMMAVWGIRDTSYRYLSICMLAYLKLLLCLIDSRMDSYQPVFLGGMSRFAWVIVLTG